MWWYGRGNSGGSWLPEKKKANMWHGRGNSGGSWPPAFPRSPGTIPMAVGQTWINFAQYNIFIFRSLKFKSFKVKVLYLKTV